MHSRVGSDTTPTERLRRLLSRVEVVEENPFEYVSHWTCYEVVKLFVVGFTMLPIRACVLVLALNVACITALVITCRLEVAHDRGCLYLDRPFTGWRSRWIWIFKFCGRAILWSMGFWRIKITDNRSNTTSCPNMIVVAPHLSFVDIFMLCWAFPPIVCAVGDGVYMKYPILGRIALAFQGIFVDIKSKDSRRACKEAMATRADPNLWRGPPTVVFPEGRITNGRRLIQYKLGAFLPGKPIQPVVLRYPHKFFNITGQGPASRSKAWPLRMMTQFYNSCEVELLEVYRPNEAETQNPEEFATSVRRLMANHLQVQTTEHTYEDAALFRQAARGRVYTDFEVQAVEDMFLLNFETIQAWLKDFQKLDSNHNGKIDRKEFRKWLRDGPLKNSSRRRKHQRCCDGGKKFLDHLFSIFDTDHSGYIEFREFIQVLALFSGRCPRETQLKLSFFLLDKEGKGVLHRDTPGLQDLLLRRESCTAQWINFDDFCMLAEGNTDVLVMAVDESSFKFASAHPRC